MKNLLETANNAFLSWKAIRKNSEWLRERWRISESRKAGLARIAELEATLTKEREERWKFGEYSGGEISRLNGRVAALESELATLRAKAEPSIPEPDSI